uniref:Protein cornichon homolog 4-like n=1 Tax=Rhizophora mucronata TaxID=61149 RepID=A0A2P2Q2W2_RHIMU
MGALLGWLLSFLLLMALIGVVGYQLMNLLDLETDHLNPYDTARTINRIVKAEYILQGLVCVAFLFTGHWFMCLLSLPYLYYNTTLYLQRRHLVDVTEIYNQLNWEKKQRTFKFLYLIALVVISLFWLLWTVGEEVD